MTDFLKIRGRDIVLGSRPTMFCGFNYGNWMLVEHYMIGLPWTEYMMRNLWLAMLGRDSFEGFWHTYMDAYATDKDFAFMKSLGCNMVQLPFNYRFFENPKGDRTCAGFEERGFQYVDRFLEMARRHGIYVLLSMHAVPGVAVRDWNAESAWGESFYWDHEHFQRRTEELWTAIAERYRNDPIVFGYEPINEPYTEDAEAFHRVALRLARAIRAADPNHIIVLNSNRWGRQIDSLRDEIFEDPQVMPSFHQYPATFPSLAGIQRYPGEHNGKAVGRADVAATFDETTDVARTGRPHLMGEFGSGVPRDGDWAASPQFAMVNDMMDICRERRFPWNYWAFKDLGPMGIVSPGPDTPWKRFLAEPAVRAIRESWGPVAHGLGELAAQHGAFGTVHQDSFIPSDWRQLLVFQCHHHWDAMALPAVLEQLRRYGRRDLEEMAESFHFRNCVVCEPRRELLQRHARAVQDLNARAVG